MRTVKRALPLATALLLVLGSHPGRAADPAPEAPPDFAPRAEWQAEKATLPMTRHTQGIREITVHHSESRGITPESELACVRAIQTYHLRGAAQEGRKLFPDIAYHFLIGPSGKIYVGRDPEYQGSSFTNYDLDGHLLICLIGDFRDAREQTRDGNAVQPDERPAGAAKHALVSLIARQLKALALTPAAVRTHRDLAASTTCPGRFLEDWLRQEGRAEIARLVK